MQFITPLNCTLDAQVMSLSKKTVIIASVAAVAVLITVTVAVVLVSRKGSEPVRPGIFKRCHGRSDPVEGIRISSCPSSTEVGYCEIDVDLVTKLELDFTAGE